MSRPWIVFTSSGATHETGVETVRLRIDARRGGMAEFTDLSTKQTVRVAARVTLDCTHTPGAPDHGRTVEIRQENDPSPEIVFLEEGPERAAIRVLYKLFDVGGHYHGDGLQETWLCRNGEAFLTLALRLVDRSAHSLVREACIEFDGVAPTAEGARAFSPALHAPFRLGFPKFKMEMKTPPFYHRWPALIHQWGGDPFEKRGWEADATSKIVIEGRSERWHWLHKAERTPTPEMCYYGLAALSFGASAAETQGRIRAHQEPLKPEIIGGEFRCYDPIDAAYEVMKTDPARLSVIFPPDPLGREARVRAFHLAGTGGILAEVEGEPVEPQLLSFGRCTDDPLVPVRVQPHGRADEAVVSLRLRPDRPTRLTLREVEGMHASYQTRDALRAVIPWRSGCETFGDLEFALLDGRARRIRRPGCANEAIAEHPLFWLLHCGHSPSQYINQLRGFEMLRNGPDRVAFRYESTNLGERVRNETWVNLPYDPRVLRLEARHRFTALTPWDHSTFEFYDTFPFWSNDPARWHYDRVLFFDGRQPPRTIGTRDELDGPKTMMDFTGCAFFALFSSDRGNILTLARRPKPEHTRLRVHLCSCWIDLHLDIYCDPAPTAAGACYEVETVTVLYGDARTTEEGLLAIAERSLKAGDIVLPQ